MPTRFGKGLLAGLVAAAAYGLVMLVNAAAGWSPSFTPPDLVSRAFDVPRSHALGWLAHFAFYGVLLGLLFAAVGPKLARIGYALRGVLFALVVWALVALLFMPAIDAGPFGMRLGYATVPLLLVAHLLYGATLGSTYAKLAHRETARIR